MADSATDHPLLTGNDFPDWLSPMLVKELRQGVRTRVFVMLFILLQVAMLMTVSLTLLVAANGGGTEAGTAFFWVIVAAPVLLILPLGGLGAINGEIKANTLELIFLTRLTAFRIVAGKWFALFTQCLLFVCAVLPYLVLRYFVGGVNLAAELQVLGWMLAGSAVLSAFTTGISAYPLRIVRAVSVLIGTALVFGFAAISETMSRGSALSVGPDAVMVVTVLGFGAIVLLLMLEIGAAKIAPPAENHSAVIRLLVVIGGLVAWAMSLYSRQPLPVIVFAFVLAALICLVGLCEEPRWIPRLFRPFAVWRWPGRMVGRLFYPGWYTAVPFTLLVFAAFGGLFRQQKLLDSLYHSLWFVALLGTLIFPVALVRFFLPGTKRAPLFYVVIHLLSAMAAILALVSDNALKTSFETPVSFVPLAALIVSASGRADAEVRFFAVCITTAASVLLLMAALVRAWRRAREAEIESLRPEVTPPPPLTDAPLA